MFIESIRIERIYHKGQDRIAVYMPYLHEKLQAVINIPGRRWSKTRKCWHLEYCKENIEILKALFPELVRKTVDKKTDIQQNPAPDCPK